MNFSKSEEVLNILSKILKIFAYLLLVFAIIIFLFQVARGPYTPVTLFLISLSSLLICLGGLIFLNLSRGLAQREKWAWVMGLTIFAANFIFHIAILILWQRGVYIYETLVPSIGGSLSSILFLSLFIFSSNLFVGKPETLSSWFGKKGFSLVFFGFIFLLCLSTGLIGYLTWATNQQAVQKQEYQKAIDELRQIEISSTQIPDSRGFIEKQISDWKIYQSEIMDLSIKYPSDWGKLEGISGRPVSGECEEISEDTLGGLYRKGHVIRFGKDPEIITAIAKINYYPYSASEESLSFEKVVEAEEEFLRDPKFRHGLRKEEIILGEISGIRMTCIYQIGEFVRIESKVLLPGKDCSIYEISTSFDAQKQEDYLPVFNLMLATLEFSSIIFEKDIISPQISNIKFENFGTSTTVTWKTNEPATSQIFYGIYKKGISSHEVPSYEFQVPENANLLYRHSMTAPGLVKGTTYHLKVISKDKDENLSSSNDIIFKFQ